MARTYWDRRPDGSFEFLGVYRDGHQVKDPKAPQGKGFVLDVTDLDVAGIEQRLALDGRPTPPLLVGLPTAIVKRLAARMPTPVPWAQIEGFVR